MGRVHGPDTRHQHDGEHSEDCQGASENSTSRGKDGELPPPACLLSRLKIPVLDSLKRDTKQKYTDALHNYVTQYFGRPLEKVNIFFDGVSARINAGGKEARGGLERLYKKVEKHLSEEENLLQVVWHAMQEEFIRQYKYIEDLLQRCYPGAQISLDFTMTDILEYFSDIAMHH